MGIDKESDIEANLQIGPTNLGMVRIYVEGEGLEIPMDFDPDEGDRLLSTKPDNEAPASSSASFVE